jgi:hypothetical protein
VSANYRAKRRAILESLEKGNTRRAAAAHAQVESSTFYRWMNSDAAFCSAVEKAEAEAEFKSVDVITAAAEAGTWQAAAWLLERNPRTKQDWKRTDELDLRKLTAEQLLELEAACSRRVESAGDLAALNSRE